MPTQRVRRNNLFLVLESLIVTAIFSTNVWALQKLIDLSEKISVMQAAIVALQTDSKTHNRYYGE